MTKKVLTTPLALSILLFIPTGCGSGGAGFGNIALSQSPVGSGGSTDKKIIGTVMKNIFTEYIQASMIGAQKAYDKYGAELKIVDDRADSLKIMDVIGTFIVQGIDGLILVGAEDLVTLVPGIKKLSEEGTSALAISTCPEGGYVDMFTISDIAGSSRKAVAQMVQGIKDASGGEAPKGVVIEITDSLVNMYTIERHEGFPLVVK